MHFLRSQANFTVVTDSAISNSLNDNIPKNIKTRDEKETDIAKVKPKKYIVGIGSLKFRN